ncbi:ABC transporter substrate-binding protein [Nonomuraea sp. K274]|uniref:ABC transporter substrate-binding protein n=1 Tax=Nonomuraea cypriaca TaxID=1187855 RepID=A0A931F3P4_9ACTN|nr:ABC transporter substrate-binding protein [Nonomuraea cypriaca]MBF8191827.1 ABC transporter substrate-binding protein [Nonomuraea cypriaca]
MRAPNRPAVLALALLVLAALAMSGCSASSSRTGVLRVVAQSEPVTLNPVYSATSDVKSWGPMFDSLVGTDRASTEPDQNGLLYGWTRVTPTAWRFKVREGVTFHNGEVFDAAAAAFSIQQIITDPKAPLAGNFSAVAGAKPVGADLEVTTKEPFPALPSMLAITMAVPPKAYQKEGGDAFGAHPIGTGPFVFSDYIRGATLETVANPHYWRGAPKLKGVTLSWSTDAQTRASFVQTGQADIALDLTPQTLRTVRADRNLTVVEKPIDARYFVYFNQKAPPFDNPDLRRAAALAIDKAGLVQGLFRQGGASVYDHFVGDLFLEKKPPAYPDAISHDLAEAKSLLASVPGPHRITFSYATGRSPNDDQIGAAIVGMLQAAGFTVTNEPMDFATFSERRNSNTMQATGLQIIVAFRDPDEEFRPWVGKTAITKNCVSAPYDELSAKALAEPERGPREEIYSQMEDLLINKDVCYVPILRYDGIWAMGKNVRGFVPPRFASPDYYEISVGS